MKYESWWLLTFPVYLKKQILLSCQILLLYIICRLSSVPQLCACVFCVHVSLCVCVWMSPLTSILVPHREHPEYEGTECGGEISPPVIPHCKVGRRDLNTEQHPWWRRRESSRGGRGSERGGRGKGRERKEMGWKDKEIEKKMIDEGEKRHRRQKEKRLNKLS